MHSDILFYLLLMMIAFIYGSVGHGGASGYMALMAFFSFAPVTMRPTALLLNIFVSLIAFVQYYRCGYFQWKLFWPFAITSIPAAFIGGLITVDEGWYKKMLAVLLLFPVLKLADIKFKTELTPKKFNITSALLIGASIGFISGMIGIGGGIILSPVLLLLHWAEMKHTAAVSALFIFVNSMAGLAGVFTHQIQLNSEMGMLIVITLAGGLTGSYFGAKKFASVLLKRMLALVLLIACVKLIFT